jgi:hypothetical protein
MKDFLSFVADSYAAVVLEDQPEAEECEPGGVGEPSPVVCGSMFTFDKDFTIGENTRSAFGEEGKSCFLCAG